MRQKMKRMMGILLSLMMMLGLMPGMRLTAFADTAYSAYVGTTTKVTFNGFDWYIIADNSTAVDAGTVTLLAADTSFGTLTFKSDGSSNSYNSSDVKAYLDKIVAGTAGEGKPNFKGVADAIQPVTLTTYKYNSSTEVAETTTDAKLYLLSTSEAQQLSSNVLKMGFNSTLGCWWLRSPGSRDDYAAFVYGDFGFVIATGDSVNYTFGVRPALKLNLSSVIFSSESNSFTLKPAHTHSFSYSASGATITATCGGTGTCDITEGLTLTISAPTGNLVYDGTTTYPATLSTGYNTTAFPGTYSISYKKDGSAYSGVPKDAGTYTASVTAGTGDGAKTASVGYTIAKAVPTITTAPTAGEITYGQTLANSTLTGGETSVAGTFAWKDSTVAPAVSDSQKTEYDVVFTPTDGNYGTTECKVKLTVKKADSAVTKAPEAKTLTYTGSAQELVTAGTATGGEMQYALGTATEATEPYTTSIPTATNAGTYYVWYKVVAVDNYVDVAPACVTVTIDGKDAGEVKTETISDPTAYSAKAGNLDQLAAAEMTDDEKKRVEQGETFLFYMEVKNIDGTVSEADKALIEQAAIEAARLAATGQESPATILQYLDFSLFKQIGTDAAQQIHQTEGDVSVTVDIPEDKQAEGRIFFIARIHDGKVEIIAQGTGKSVTCSSNLFSTYALLYVDPPKQEAAPTETMDTLLATMLSGGEDTLNLMWTTVPDAAGYEVFFGKSRPKYVATVTGNSYTFTGLKKGASYKAYVKAAGQTSPVVLCYTDKANIPGSNPAQVTLYDTEITVTISKYAKIRSSIRRPAGTKGRYSRRRLYVSSDPSVATVTRGGHVKGVSKGECTVYVMNNNGVWKGVKVVVDTQPTKVGFKKARRLMKVGESQTITVKLTPKQAETILTWQTSDPNVATVDETGTVTAAGEGRATITATAENGKAATVNIRVKGFAVSANETPEEDGDALPLEVQLNEPEA